MLFSLLISPSQPSTWLLFFESFQRRSWRVLSRNGFGEEYLVTCNFFAIAQIQTKHEFITRVNGLCGFIQSVGRLRLGQRNLLFIAFVGYTSVGNTNKLYSAMISFQFVELTNLILFRLPCYRLKPLVAIPAVCVSISISCGVGGTSLSTH